MPLPYMAEDLPPDLGDCAGPLAFEAAPQIAAPDRTDLIVHQSRTRPSRVRMEVCGVGSQRADGRQGASLLEEAKRKTESD